MNKERPSEEPKDAETEPHISSKEELVELNQEVDLGNPKSVLISSQLLVQENE